MQLLNELRPVDRFITQIPFPLSSYERKLVTLLYQPLIGPEPISLYFQLWAEGEDREEVNYSHYHLMNSLGMSIHAIFKARIALEAIGLIRTYKKEDDQFRYFAYDVMPPLEARRFFDDPLLSMFLFSKIGEKTYRSLRQRFLPKGVSKEGMEEVSRQFTDVYKPIQQHMPANDFEQPIIEKPIDIPFEYREFDFNLLFTSLSEAMIPHRYLTPEIKECIAKTAFTYNFNALDMKNVLILAIQDDDTVSPSAIRKAASEFYKLNVSKTPPEIAMMNPSEEKFDENKGWGNRYEELVEYFEKTSMIEVLKGVNNDQEPFEQDIELFADLVGKYEMEVPVVNVLIHYVYLSSDLGMNKKFVQTIAANWRKKEISTAAQAMREARDFIDKKSPTTKKNPIENTHQKFLLLQSAAHNFYQTEVANKQKIKTFEHLEADFIQLVSKTEPITMLNLLSDGKEPFSKDIKIVKDFAAKYEFENPVLNTLLHYAYFISEGSLNAPFLEAIASTWRKNEVKTVEEAIKVASNQRKSNAQKYGKTSYSGGAKKELPKWINSSEKPSNLAQLEELERQFKKNK
ncbi:hypothetical protein KZO01_04030 [Kurthia zopfii]|uniref:Replication initiation and membrane attachment protein n=1 Tax=Kurthia zopfii TaxID=1650 RepID=A0A8B4QC94_9BACL|nr:DnaD domain protein [Kurthia zopfii]PWI23073.1 replication initiation protein [Kurthia zopfii]TDR40535.1 replicative DNA helicase loader DnaB [Kurthia zopfii]GEK30094.1 hypothetical protein KZO01_04030 [Kurthia zopfii]STX10274.1 Replication initiation and membrane attachment protein [Kurthia zopfii]